MIRQSAVRPFLHVRCDVAGCNNRGPDADTPIGARYWAHTLGWSRPRVAGVREDRCPDHPFEEGE